MPDRRLHIGALRVRIRGLAQAPARAVAAGLAEDIAHGLAPLLAGARVGVVHVDRLDAGAVRASERASTAALREQAAAAVVEALRPHLARDGEA